MAVCEVCFRHCNIKEGAAGFCGAREARNGAVVAGNYGHITSLSLDPIEKKPLKRFHPGSFILSAGSYGCNLRCPFCQNSEISWSESALSLKNRTEYVSPEELVETASYHRKNGNIGLAFTYNEPLIGYEYVLDAAKLSTEMGMQNVLVTNGTVELAILEKLKPYIHAMNIDLKGFTDDYYNRVLGGNRRMVTEFIREAVRFCHVELTTLIVPGENDSEEEMREISSWISELTDVFDGAAGSDITLHISRFFPRFHMTDRPATSVEKIYRLRDIAKEKLNFVYTGNC